METEYLILIIPSVILSFIVILFRPSIGLSILIAFDLFYKLYIGKEDLTGLGIGNGVIVGMMMLAVFIREDYKKRIKTPVDNLMLIFLSLGIVYGLIGFIRENEPSTIFGDLYHIIPEISITFFLATTVLNDKEKIVRFIKELSIITAIFLSFLFFEYLSGGVLVLEGRSARFYEQEDFVRLGFGTIFPIFHIFIFYSLWIFSEKGLWKSTFGILTIPLLIVLVLTMRRTSMIALAATLIFIHLLIKSRDNIKVVAAISFSAIIFFLVALFLVSQFGVRMPERLTSISGILGERVESIGVENPSLSNRIRQFKDAAEIIHRNPLGYGLGSRFVMHSAKGVRPIHYVHNSILHYSIQTGAITILIYLSILVIFFKEGIRLFFTIEGGYLKGIILGFVAASFAQIIEGLTDVAMNTFYFSIGMGIVFVIKDKMLLNPNNAFRKPQIHPVR